MSIPIGISTLVDLDLSMPELLDRIAAAGFSHIGLSHDVQHAGYHTAAGRRALAGWLSASGLKLDYIHPPITAYIDLCSLDPWLRQSAISLHIFLAEACSELGGQALTVHINNAMQLDESELEARADVGADSLVQLINASRPLSVLICVENQPGFMASEKLTQKILADQFALPGIWCTLDPNHARIGNENYLELVAEMAPRVRATHIADTMGEHDSHQVPGEGSVDFAAVARLLGAQGYGKAAGGEGLMDYFLGQQAVVNLESSLWMLRKRLARGEAQPGDPATPPTTDEYLQRCADAARRIAAAIEAAWPL